MVEWKGSKDLQCSMLSLHFSNLIIYVSRIIQKPRQNWSVPAFISQNVNVEVCNLTLNRPSSLWSKALGFLLPMCCFSLLSLGCGGSSRIQGWAQLSWSWACPAPREECRVEVAHGTPKPSNAFCVFTGIPLALSSCCGQTGEGFRCLQKFGELQKSPYKSQLEIARGMESASWPCSHFCWFIFTQPLGCCRQRCLSWQWIMECFHFPPVLSVELVPGCLGEEQLLSLAMIQCWRSQGV